ncbi:hypothetical protein GGI09_004749 [Coemansia sp. S100]|nr:hypothetical protein GGI09_004749 [Coemansia sp. S100]
MCLFNKIASVVFGFARKCHHEDDNDNDVRFKRRRQALTPGAPSTSPPELTSAPPPETPSAPLPETPSAPPPETPSMVANEYNSGGIQNADTAALPSPARSAMSSKIPRAPGTARPKKRVRFQLPPLQNSNQKATSCRWSGAFSVLGATAHTPSRTSG